jgi:lipopolysaccharide transport system ATP-binding protein
LYRVEALCDRALWLDRGHVRSWDGALDVVRAYLDSEERKILATEAEGTKMQAEGAGYPVVVERVELLDSQGISSWEFAFGGGMIVRIHYVAQRRIERPLFNLRILHSGQGVMEASMLIDGYGPEWIEGRGVVECYFDRLPLTPKVYDILLFARSADGVADIIHMDTYARFRVTDAGLSAISMDGPMALNHLRQGSPIYVPRTWRFYSGNELTSTLESSYNDRR